MAAASTQAPRLTRSRALKEDVAIASKFETPPDVKGRRSKKLQKRLQRQQSQTPLSLPPSPCLSPAPATLSSPSPPQRSTEHLPAPITPVASPIEDSLWTVSSLKMSASSFLASITSWTRSPIRRSVSNTLIAEPSTPSPIISEGESTTSSPKLAVEAPPPAQDPDQTPKPTTFREDAPASPTPIRTPKPITPRTTKPIVTPRSKFDLPYQRPMLTGRRKKLRLRYEQLQEEKQLRAQGFRSDETEEERKDRKDTEYQFWLMNAHQKARRGDFYDAWDPDSSQELGSKRKNVGKTFAVPEADSESDFDPTSPMKESTGPRQFLTPKSPLKNTRSPNVNNSPQPLSHIPAPLLAPPSNVTSEVTSAPGVGRTFAVPEDSSSDEFSLPEVRDSELMSFTNTVPQKSVLEWTEADYETYLKIEYDFDANQLAKEMSSIPLGAVPPSFMKAFKAMKDFRNRAVAEYTREKGRLEMEVENMRRECQQQKDLLVEDKLALIKERSLVRANYNGETLSHQVNHDGPRENNVLGFPYCSPDTSSTLENVFAVAAANASNNITATQPTDLDQNSTPTLAFNQTSQPPATPSKQPSVTWVENVIHNHAAPGPNEPIKSGTPLPKSALKGRQLESLERKMSEATRYTPKQPSRLREVSEVAKPVTNHIIPPYDPNVFFFQITENPYPHIRENLHLYYDEMPTGFDNLLGNTTMENMITHNPYPESRQIAMDMIMQVESQH